MHSSAQHNAWRNSLPFLLGSALLLISGIFLLGPGGRDDVYKTLWSAEAFAATGRILNYNGDAIEQSSSLLHVLVLGGLRTVIGGPIADLNLGLTLFCGLLGIYLGLRLAGVVGLKADWALGLALGGQGMWVYWSMGGLDAVLSADCWLLFLLVLIPGLEDGRWRMLPLALLPLILVRPENGLIAMAALGLCLLLELVQSPKSITNPANRRLMFVLGLTLLVFAALLTWRIWHGGHWLPQSARAKTDGLHWDKIRHGLGYLVLESYRHLELLPLWLGLGIAAWRMIRRRFQSRGMQLLFCVLVVGLSFVVVSGGDWMENGRFLVPFIPMLIILLFAEFAVFRQRWQLPVRLAYLVGSAAGLIWIAAHFNLGYPLFSKRIWDDTKSLQDLSFSERNNKVHLRDAHPYRMLRQFVDSIYAEKGAPLNILSQQAGFMMYHLAKDRSGKFRFVDLVGLSTTDFTECPVTRDRGRARGGLNMDLVFLFGDFERIQGTCGIARPDIVFGLDDADFTLSLLLKGIGYTNLELQTGTMPAGGIFEGMQVDAIEFVAVDDRWLEAIFH